MATIDRALAMELIANDGHYLDDDRAVEIIEYTNFNGQPAYAVTYETDRPDRYRESEYVRQPIVIWHRGIKREVLEERIRQWEERFRD